MNDKRTGGTNWVPLLLIPVAIILMKGAARRRAMWESDAPRALRLPPRIESALDAWHARAHEGSASTTPDAQAPAV